MIIFINCNNRCEISHEIQHFEKCATQQQLVLFDFSQLNRRFCFIYLFILLLFLMNLWHSAHRFQDTEMIRRKCAMISCIYRVDKRERERERHRPRIMFKYSNQLE